MIKICVYSDAYILVKGTISVTANTIRSPVRNNKQVILKNCTPFVDYTTEIINTH